MATGIHIAGTPCTDFSLRGSQDGADGVTIVYLYAWAAQRRDLQEEYVVQENVVQFEIELLDDLLGDLYHIDAVVTDPTSTGWPVNRTRRYIIMRHKIKTGSFATPLNQFARLFLKLPSDMPKIPMPAWDAFFVAGPQDLEIHSI